MKFSGSPIGKSHHVDFRPERATHDVVERIFAVGTYVWPRNRTPHHQRSLGSIHTDFVESGMLRISGGIQYPAVGRSHGILRIITVVANLARRTAVTFGGPNFKIASAVGTPEQMFAVRRDEWIPVGCGVVGETADVIGLGGNFPKIHVAAPRRRKDDGL